MRIHESPGWVALLVGLVLALSAGSVITFQAPSPGADLEHAGGNRDAVSISQDETSVTWKAEGTTVSGYQVQGWPAATGTDELGGGLILSRAIEQSGVIAFGERPMLLVFEISS